MRADESSCVDYSGVTSALRIPVPTARSSIGGRHRRWRYLFRRSARPADRAGAAWSNLDQSFREMFGKRVDAWAFDPARWLRRGVRDVGAGSRSTVTSPVRQ